MELFDKFSGLLSVTQAMINSNIIFAFHMTENLMIIY